MSKSEGPTRPLEGEALFFQLFNEIGIINQLASTMFERSLPHGLTMAQFTVLNHCVRLGDGQTPAALASAFQLTRGTLTSTLKRLEAKDFIELARDPEDGRSKRVFITKAGRAAREESILAAFPLLARVKDGFGEERTKQMLPALAALRQWLDGNRQL